MGFIIKIALFCAFCYGAYSLIPQPASSPSPSATAASGSIDSGLDDPIDPAPVEKRKTNENGFAQSVKFASLPDRGTRRSSSTEVNRITPRGDRGFVPFPVRVPSLSDRAKVNHARQSGKDEGRDLAADDFGEDYSPPASSGRSSGGNQTFVQSSGGTKALRVVGVVCKASVARTGCSASCSSTCWLIAHSCTAAPLPSVLRCRM